MATVLLPRSLLALFPGVDKRNEVAGGTVGELISGLDASVPGLRDRLVEAGPRLRRTSTCSWTASRPTSATAVDPASVVHVLPAVSGG